MSWSDCISKMSWSWRNMKWRGDMILFLQSGRASQQTYTMNMLLVFLYCLVLLGPRPAICFFIQQPCLSACLPACSRSPAADMISHSLINWKNQSRRRKGNCYWTPYNLRLDRLCAVNYTVHLQPLQSIQWDLTSSNKGAFKSYGVSKQDFIMSSSRITYILIITVTGLNLSTLKCCDVFTKLFY